MFMNQCIQCCGRALPPKHFTNGRALPSESKLYSCDFSLTAHLFLTAFTELLLDAAAGQ